MTPERWKRIEELFFAAAAEPASARAALLSEACGDDDDLRHEVESLLTASEADSGIVAALAVGPPPTATPSQADSAMLGRSLGGYELQSLLGAGGMGEVYRARDTRLHRDVAIKILPSGVTRDPDRLARFEREARMLAAVNHPNICAIYGIESIDGVRFLILELVDGPTLADLLSGTTALSVDTAIRLARQIADALDVAHEKGIVHRDLKPANIKITSEGTVKVLDFGLAKNVDAQHPSPDLTHVPSGEMGGAVLGTAAYMSPEQARGQPVDKRTDIWAFGCVLFQMVTGRVPFAGETTSDTVARILEREPDWSALPPTMPARIRRVLARCLHKDHKQRMRDIGDARSELTATDEPSRDATVGAPAFQSRRWLPAITAIIGVALAAAALGAVAMSSWSRATMPNEPLGDFTLTRVTNWAGSEEGAVISPDGRFVAFLSDHEGEFDVWLSQIGTGHFSNLTRDFPALVGAGSIVRKLGFNGDASELWFNPADRKPLLLMPLTGGVPRPFLPPASNTPAWSPDGTRLVYFGKPATGADPMYVADGRGSDSRELYTPPSPVHSNNPVWSADGQWIYFVSGTEPQDETDVDIWRVRATGGPAEQLTNQHAAANFVAPIDAGTLLYVSRDEDGSGPWLWVLDTDSRSRRRVQAGVEQFTSVSASGDGRRLVATIANPSSTLWRVPILGRTTNDQDAELYDLPMPTGRAWAPRFSSRSLFFLSARGSGDGLWKVDGDTPSEVWRNVDGVIAEPAAIAHDGTMVAVILRRAGKRQLSLMSADGTNARLLAPSIEIEGAAGQGSVDWSPDGASIVAGGQDGRGDGLFRIPVNGGDPIRVREGKWVNPLWSPKGDLIVYAGRSNVGQVAPLAMRPDGTAVDFPEFWARPGGYRFLPDGSGLVYIPAIHALNFWLLDFATMTTRPLTQFGKHGMLKTFDITPDGKHIVFDRSRENSDVVLIDLRR